MLPPLSAHTKAEMSRTLVVWQSFLLAPNADFSGTAKSMGNVVYDKQWGALKKGSNRLHSS